MSNAPTTEFPPTLREVMLRPQWIAMLGLCLVIAGIFAWLGQWQLERSIDTDPPPAGATEEVRPLAEVVEPGHYLNEPLVGQRVEVMGSWVPGDFLVVSSRFNDGEEGYWVTGQFRIAGTTEPTSIAVVAGWTENRSDAEAAAAALDARAGATIEVTGRIISDEGPALPPRGADPFEMTRMSPAALVDRWHDTDGLSVFRPYLTAEQPFAELERIHSPAPEAGSTINWLNLFYAAEWAIFAGFAFYLWYRLAKDAWEKEIEALEDAAAEAV